MYPRHRMTQSLLTLLLALAIVPRSYGDSEGKTAAASTDDSPRLLVHLLDYLAKDYGGAVSSTGTVLSVSEYKEQQEFSESAVKTAGNLPQLTSHPEIQSGVNHLHDLIAAKAVPTEVSALARGLQQQVITATNLEVAPPSWPSLAHGQDLYTQNCAGCHGASGAGDGPAATALGQKPANFLDKDLLASLAPLQAFNTIRLGVPGTPMVPFPNLSDEEAWNVAFYVLALHHGGQNSESWHKFSDTPPTSDAASSTTSAPSAGEALKLAATSTDDFLLARMNLESVRALRLTTAETGMQDALRTARTLINAAALAYRQEHYDDAKTKALKAYLDGIEPVEPRVRATDPGAVSLTEERMAAVRGAIEGRVAVADLDVAVNAALAQIDVLETLLTHKDLDPSVAFVAASAILLREGFEAVLLILALLGVIRASGAKRAALWVHGGWLSALLAGALLWVFSGFLMQVSGAQRETLEAWTSLLAVVILLFVGFWLHSRTEIGRWNYFLKVKVRAAVTGKNLFGLAMIAFIAVFREAFETVLFLRAIWLEGGQNAKLAMAASVGLTLATIIFGAWAVLRFSAQLPVRKLFGISAVIMAVLAFILTGKGLHSLQETGMLGVNTAVFPVHWEFFGLYPTWETLAPQIFVLVLCCGLWIYGRRPSAR